MNNNNFSMAEINAYANSMPPRIRRIQTPRRLTLDFQPYFNNNIITPYIAPEMYIIIPDINITVAPDIINIPANNIIQFNNMTTNNIISRYNHNMVQVNRNIFPEEEIEADTEDDYTDEETENNTQYINNQL